jgi:oxygen-dependent protoporphyrinogen oxidase
MEIVIVAGGIAGMSAALECSTRSGMRVTLVEASGALGGKLQTASLETPLGSAIVDGAAESFVTRKPEALTLAHELGLQDEVLEPGSEMRGVSVVRGGRVLRVPTSPTGFLRQNALGARGAARMLLEPFLRAPAPEGDESLHCFLERRFGARAAAVYGPVMAGIYSGNPRQQSVEASFGVLRDLERTHGSLVRGMLRAAKRAKPQTRVPRAIALRGGVRQLIGALEARLQANGVTIRLNAPARRLETTTRGQHLWLEDGQSLRADAVILAVPAPAAARLLEGSAPQASRALETIRHTGIGTVALAYPKAALEGLQHHRGVMIPRGEGSAVDAVLFTGFKMPQRVHGDIGVLRVFFGANLPEMLHRDEAALLETMRAELHTLFGITAAPLAHALWRWDDFPLLEVGHLERVKRVETALPPGVFLAGASYRGLGVPDCIRQGRAAARLALATRTALETVGA